MTPQEIAAGVAADIRERGRYTLGADGPVGCCFVTAPTATFARADGGADMARFLGALRDALNLTDTYSLPYWFDGHPTEQALAVLDELAAL